MADLKRFLKQAQGATWKETVERASENTFENPADGVYIMLLSSAELGESKKGNVQIKWGYTIVEGDLAGQKKWDFMGLEGPLGLDPLAWRLSSLGYNIADVNLEKLEEVLDEIVSKNMYLKTRLTTKPDSDFQNMRIVKVLPEDFEPDTPIPSTSTKTAEPKAKAAPAAEVEEDAELVVGMPVSFKDEDGDEIEGKVTAINEETEEVTVKVGKKEHTVPAADLTIIDNSKDA